MPRNNTTCVWPLLAAVLAAGSGLASAAGGLKLHVPSPDWRDQVIYFAMTDRFANGDPRNDDQGAGEFKPGDGSRWQGGDLAGARQRLDYVQGLGATALWLTPVVANQWLDPSGRFGGHHGYWAENFTKVDRHLGTLADYQRLSDALHRRGMYLVHDIVVNHMGNYFGYGPDWSAADPARGFMPFATTPPVPRPSQWPFSLNDPRRAADRRAGVYHWTPDVTDYAQPVQELSYQMGGLDDLDTESPLVRRALRASHGRWIREAGVDAFRVDTAFYVPPDFFADFLFSRDRAAPGIAEVARRTGRRDFLVFGEGWGIDVPGRDEKARKIERYMHDEAGRPLMGGMLNFPLYGALNEVFARGQPPALLGERIGQMLALFPRLHWMPSFVDNHDVDRFLAGGSTAGLRQALLALMTLPGIPVISWGTEQGFSEQRGSMFAAGFGSGGRDRFDTASPLYRSIAAMTALRRGDRLFSRGRPAVIAASAATPGALAWRIEHEGAQAVVAFNTATGDALLAAFDTGLPEGSVLVPAFGLDGLPPEVVVGAGGRLVLPLPAQAGWVWKLAGPRRQAGAPAAAPTLQLPAGELRAGDFDVSGQAAPGASLKLVVDGDLAAAQVVTAGADGRWRATVDTGSMIDPAARHALVAWAGGDAASPPASFRVQRAWRELVDLADPAGDDAGPAGRYLYPSDPGFRDHRPMDLRRVRVASSGGALRIELTMGAITTPWNPPNGFDHVAFTVYIELPGAEGGATVMPLQNGQLPGGMRWHRRLRVGGWTNALFAPDGASESVEGRPLTPGAAVATDRAVRTVTLTLPAAALGRPAGLGGARIYVTTWDYDGGYRPLAPAAEPFALGGGPADGLKVMDDAGPITLP